MIRTILVPVDGSALSERAVHHAHTLARTLGARIVLMRAVLGARTPSEAEQERYTDGEVAADQELTALALAIRQEGVDVSCLMVDYEASQAILDTATGQDVDLIVMSTHGRTGIGRVIYGSIADRVVRESTIPVLLIPPSADREWATASPLRIVVPLDGSADAEEALPVALELADGRPSTLILVQAVPPPNYVSMAEGGFYAEYDPDLELSRGRDYLRKIAGRMVHRQVRAQISVAEGTTHEVILDALREKQAHLVVMTTHGRGGFTRLVLGSTADGVLRGIHTPLLLVRPQSARALAAHPLHTVVAPARHGTALTAS